jgi:hypothetical protein
MDQQIHLRLGAEPWRPADTARLSKVLNHYDVPLAGILKQHGSYFLFECLEGEVQDANLWAYVPIRRATARRLARLTSDRLMSAIHDAYMNHDITAVLAVDGAIVRGVTLELVPANDDLRGQAFRAVKRKVEQDASAINGLVAIAG